MPYEYTQAYPCDLSDDEWAFVAPYLTLLSEDAMQRKHDLREVFNALRWLLRTGAQWLRLPHDFPRWEAIYQQTLRWLRAGCFEASAHDLRLVLRLAAGRRGQPLGVILDGRTVQSTPESGKRDGHGSAVDPFLDREEALRWVRHTVINAPAGVATAEEQALVVRALDAVVDELQAHAAGEQDTAQDTTDEAGTADESDELAVVADGAAHVERIETAEAP